MKDKRNGAVAMGSAGIISYRNISPPCNSAVEGVQFFHSSWNEKYDLNKCLKISVPRFSDTKIT